MENLACSSFNQRYSWIILMGNQKERCYESQWVLKGLFNMPSMDFWCSRFLWNDNNRTYFPCSAATWSPFYYNLLKDTRPPPLGRFISWLLGAIFSRKLEKINFDIDDPILATQCIEVMGEASLLESHTLLTFSILGKRHRKSTFSIKAPLSSTPLQIILDDTGFN